MSLRLALLRSIEDRGGRTVDDGDDRAVDDGDFNDRDYDFFSDRDDDFSENGVDGGYCRGHCMFFTAQPDGAGGSKIIGQQITKRNRLDVNSTQRSYIENTSMTGFNLEGKQSVCAFRRDSKDDWSLGIVQCYGFLDDMIMLYEWDGNDDVFTTTKWEEQACHFELVQLTLSKIDLHWVNQVSGSTCGGGRVPVETRCHIDGSIQCLVKGPDKWPAQVPTLEVPRKGTEHLGLDRYKLEEKDKKSSEYKDSFEHRRFRGGNKRKQHDDDTSPEQVFIDSTRKKPPIIRIKNQQGVVAVVTDLNNKPLSVERATRIDKRFKDKFLLPLISSKGCEQDRIEYALITKAQLRIIEKMEFNEATYAKDVKEHLGDDIDIVNTLSTDNVERMLKAEGLLNEKEYNGSFRLFVGASAPTAAELEKMNFATVDMGDIRIHYGVCKASMFNEMIPLSWSFFQMNVHRIRVPYSLLDLVTKAVGRLGSFSNRSTTTCSGSCSFVGPRQSHQAQPSPSAGPSIVNNGHMLHRQKNDPRYTPGVYKLINFLGKAALAFSMGLHYHLFHVIRYVLDFPFSEFGLCCLGIITINFCNSLHVDAGDDMESDVYEEVKAKLELMVKTNTKRSIAQSCLDFLNWGGTVSVATTCLYQHIPDGEGGDNGNNEEEIICYFPMLSSSVSLRLKPWLVHHFFASKISHCTSVPLFRYDNKIYVGKPPGKRKTAIFAWGESSPTKRSVASRTRSKTKRRRKRH